MFAPCDLENQLFKVKGRNVTEPRGTNEFNEPLRVLLHYSSLSLCKCARNV